MGRLSKMAKLLAVMSFKFADLATAIASGLAEGEPGSQLLLNDMRADRNFAQVKHMTGRLANEADIQTIKQSRTLQC